MDYSNDFSLKDIKKLSPKEIAKAKKKQFLKKKLKKAALGVSAAGLAALAGYGTYKALKKPKNSVSTNNNSISNSTDNNTNTLAQQEIEQAKENKAKKSDISGKMSAQKYLQSKITNRWNNWVDTDKKRYKRKRDIDNKIEIRLLDKLPDKKEILAAYHAIDIPEDELIELMRNYDHSGDEVMGTSKAFNKKDLVEKKSNIIGRQFAYPVWKSSDGKIHVKRSYLKAKEITDKLNDIDVSEDDPLKNIFSVTFDNRRKRIDYSNYDIDMDAINKHNAAIDAKNKNKVVTQSAIDYIDDLLDTFYEAYYYDLLTDNEYEAFVESVYEADNIDEIEDIEDVFESYIE